MVAGTQFGLRDLLDAAHGQVAIVDVDTDITRLFAILARACQVTFGIRDGAEADGADTDATAVVEFFAYGQRIELRCFSIVEQPEAPL